MKKRLFSFAMMLVMAVTAFAYSFTGKTYKGDLPGGSMTVKFTSASRGTMTLKANGQSESKSFRYEVSGQIINLYVNGGIDYIYIDTDQDYGNDAIYMVDPYGNPYIVLERTASSSGTSKKKKR